MRLWHRQPPAGAVIHSDGFALADEMKHGHAIATPAAVHRPDIDGLRAVAILSVICFHAFPRVLSGGFVGVDVFFVISGYLISSILFRDAQNGAIRFFDFYRRRVNRIFPALGIMLIGVMAFGALTLFAKEFHDLGADVAAGASFSSNFSLLGEAGYFDRDAATKPLLHLWSLAVEEQFYIFWPALIWFIRRAKANWTWCIGTFAALSFGYNVFESGRDPVADFYLPLTRFWEPAGGALLAARLFDRRPREEVVSWRNHATALLGFGMLAAAMGTASTGGYPGLQALLPVLGTVLLLTAGPQAGVNRLLLAHPAMRWVGYISYPLYLWHWPLLAYARILEGQIPRFDIRIGALVLALILATATHYFIENPMRFGPFAKRKMAASVVALALIGGVGQFIFLRGGLPLRPVIRLNPDLGTGADGGPGPGVVGACYQNSRAPLKTDGCLMDARETPIFALIGDSKAGALAPGVFRTSTARGRWLYLGNNSARGQALSTTLLEHADYPREYALTRQMLDIVEAHAEIRTVVIADATRTLFQLADDTTIDDLPASPYGPRALRAFDAVVTELTASGRQVDIVVDNPTLAHPEDCVGRISSSPLINRLLGLPNYPAGCSIELQHFLALSGPYRQLLDRLAARHPNHVRLIETSDIFCDRAHNICPLERDGRIYYGYSDHASDYAAGLVGARINAVVRRDAAVDRPPYRKALRP